VEPLRVDANGLRFAYLERGTGPLVLLLHGFPDTAHTWDRTLGEVAGIGHRAVAPFLRGYHPTEIPRDGRFDVETLGRDALALIEALGEHAAVLVGHDWGALTALCAAALAPERVRLLVTLGLPHPAGLWPTPRRLWHLRHLFALRRRSAAAKIRAGELAYIDALWRRASPAWHDLPAAETAEVKAAFAEPGCLEAACAYYAALSPRLPQALRAAIDVPAVAFAGEHDLVSPRLFEKVRRRYAASYEVVQVPGGHFMHREHPDTFHRELVRVLVEHSGSPSR
jgi:pimeloyl-ACP methyl ester carboxylesterase